MRRATPVRASRSDDAPGGTMQELDVRPMPPRERHETIFGRLDGLRAGEQLRLVNDHDPAPLRYQLDATRPSQFRWEYVQRGPEEWVVDITSTAHVVDARPVLAAGGEPFGADRARTVRADTPPGGPRGSRLLLRRGTARFGRLAGHLRADLNGRGRRPAWHPGAQIDEHMLNPTCRARARHPARDRPSAASPRRGVARRGAAESAGS